jgi:hypothetical protein
VVKIATLAGDALRSTNPKQVSKKLMPLHYFSKSSSLPNNRWFVHLVTETSFSFFVELQHDQSNLIICWPSLKISARIRNGLK